MKTKKLLALLLSFAMVLGAVGCGASNSNDAEETPTNAPAAEVEEEAEPEEGGVLTLFVQAADETRISIKDDYIIPNFEKAFPGWKLEVTVIGTDDTSVAAMKTYNSTGDLPDVYWSDSRWSIPMIKSGNQLDLSSYIGSDGFVDKYNGGEGFMSYKGGVYALQPGSDAKYYPVFYYNTKVFEENNIQVPTTLDELFEVCDKLLVAGVTPFTLDGKGAYLDNAWFQMILALVDYTKVDALLNNEIDFTDPAILETIQIIEDMLAKGYFGDRKAVAARTTGEYTEMFASGQVAMHADFYWNWSVYDNGETDFFLLKDDNGDTRINVWGNSVNGYAVYSGSEHVDMAVKLAEYCCEQEAIYHNEHGTATVFDTGIEPEATSELQKKLNDVYNETKLKQNTIRLNAFDSYVIGEFRTMLSALIAEQMTAEDFVKEFQTVFEQNTMFE